MSRAWEDPRIRRGMTAQLDRRRARLDAGESPLGWKVGFGAPAAMERLAIEAPLVGFLTSGGLLESGAMVSIAAWARPVAEPEVAVHMGRDLPGGADLDTAREAIAGVGPAIELADVDPPPDDVADILAGNIYHRHVIVGPPDSGRAGGSLDGMVARVSHNGVGAATTSDLEELPGELIGIVRHVADVLAAFGEGLRAGEIIIGGSVVPPLPVAPGDEVVFTLDPFPALSVHFADG